MPGSSSTTRIVRLTTAGSAGGGRGPGGRRRRRTRRRPLLRAGIVAGGRALWAGAIGAAETRVLAPARPEHPQDHAQDRDEENQLEQAAQQPEACSEGGVHAI